MTEQLVRQDPMNLTDDGDHHEAVIAEALAVIDQALGRVTGRDLVSSGEVADLLLDVRMLLTTQPAVAS